MIVSIKGRIVQRLKESIVVSVQNMGYEIFLPKTVYDRLATGVEETEVELITYHYLHADHTRSIPVLIGFLHGMEKEFFEQFITVSGIGPRAAMRALDKPISQIAAAINEGDIYFLKSLPGIGPQKAKQIVAQLQGKMSRFGLINDAASPARSPMQEQDVLKEEALEALKKLQYRRTEALSMIERALKANPHVKTIEELLNEIYIQRKHAAVQP